MGPFEYDNGIAHSDTHGAKDGDAVSDGSGHNVWTVGSHKQLHIRRYTFCIIQSG